jgi:DNA polymerase III epsilon subunit-like protein
MQPERYAVIDVETTGFSATRDRIVEVACALIDGERIVGRWATLVDPGIAIPAYATAVHGITDEMVSGAPRLGRALELCAIRPVFRGAIGRAEGALHDAARAGALSRSAQP